MSKLNLKKNEAALKALTLFVLSVSLLNTACSKKEVEELTNNSDGGTVQGLNGKIVLSNNNSDEITVSNDGAFIFPNELGITNRYQVSIVEQPDNQTCTVNNASGVITVSEIRDVVVVCSAASYFIGFTVTGLTGTVQLLNNGTDVTTISADGSYVFPTYLADGGNYNVTVVSQPAGQTCDVTQGSGTLSADVTDIFVDCHP
jgi:hypothetical protein